MAKKLDQKELTTTEELFWANMYQLDAVTQLLIEKGIITEQEFFTKLSQDHGDGNHQESTCKKDTRKTDGNRPSVKDYQ